MQACVWMCPHSNKHGPRFSTHIAFFFQVMEEVGGWRGLFFTTMGWRGNFNPSRHEQSSEKHDKQAGSAVLPRWRQRHWCPL